MLLVVNLLEMDVRKVLGPQRRGSSQTQPHHPVKQTGPSGQNICFMVFNLQSTFFNSRAADLCSELTGTTGGPAGESL